MNWEALGAIGELVGAAAVFISLLYLGIQIRNSRRSDQIIASANLSRSIDDWVREIVQDAELHELYRNGISDYESLHRDEKGRFGLLMFQYFRAIEAGWILARSGFVDRSYWAGVEHSMQLVIASTGGRKAFNRYRQMLGPEFAAEVDRLLAIEENST